MAETRRKDCDCHPATASGPRVITTRTPSDLSADAYTFTGTLVEIACDVCDKPWVRAHIEGEGEQ